MIEKWVPFMKSSDSKVIYEIEVETGKRRSSSADSISKTMLSRLPMPEDKDYGVVIAKDTCNNKYLIFRENHFEMMMAAEICTQISRGMHLLNAAVARKNGLYLKLLEGNIVKYEGKNDANDLTKHQGSVYAVCYSNCKQKFKTKYFNEINKAVNAYKNTVNKVKEKKDAVRKQDIHNGKNENVVMEEISKVATWFSKKKKGLVATVVLKGVELLDCPATSEKISKVYVVEANVIKKHNDKAITRDRYIFLSREAAEEYVKTAVEKIDRLAKNVYDDTLKTVLETKDYVKATGNRVYVECKVVEKRVH